MGYMQQYMGNNNNKGKRTIKQVLGAALQS